MEFFLIFIQSCNLIVVNQKNKKFLHWVGVRQQQLTAINNSEKSSSGHLNIHLLRVGNSKQDYLNAC